MSGEPQHELTGLLQAWRGGDRVALDRLVTHVHAELHRLAHVHLSRERPGQTLQTSALVNEAYLRLIDASHVDWQDRAHFFAVAATIMRQVLIQYARARHARKRGGGAVRVDFSEAFIPSPYAKQQSSKPVVVMSCEGGCLRGEVARRAANLLTFEVLTE